MLSAYGPHFVDVKHGLSTPYTLSNLSRWGLHSKKVGEICQAIPASLTPTLTSYLYQDFGTEVKHDSPQAIQLCYVSYVNIDSHYQLAQELIFCPYSRIAWNLLLSDLQDLRRFFNMVDPTKKYKKKVFFSTKADYSDVCWVGTYWGYFLPNAPVALIQDRSSFDDQIDSGSADAVPSVSLVDSPKFRTEQITKSCFEKSPRSYNPPGFGMFWTSPVVVKSWHSQDSNRSFFSTAVEILMETQRETWWIWTESDGK